MKPVVALSALVLAAASLAAHAAPLAPAVQASVVKGEVLETRDVDGYTYLRLKTAQGETWAAVPTTTAKKGAQVTIGDSMVMDNFESKTLKKVFDKIVFGQIVDTGAKAATPHGAPPVATAPVAKLAKAAGPDARTVAEVVKGRVALNNKTVVVHGQVVKASLGIMGKNWLHLQDGSGSPTDGSNDILVTTTQAAAVGDIVNASGTVHADVNLGSGYAYAVLIENAAVHK